MSTKAGNQVAQTFDAAAHLASIVGSGYGLAYTVAILLLFPKWGLAFPIIQMIGEQLKDWRKHKSDLEKLKMRYDKRPQQKKKTGSHGGNGA